MNWPWIKFNSVVIQQIWNCLLLKIWIDIKHSLVFSLANINLQVFLSGHHKVVMRMRWMMTISSCLTSYMQHYVSDNDMWIKWKMPNIVLFTWCIIKSQGGQFFDSIIYFIKTWSVWKNYKYLWYDKNVIYLTRLWFIAP